MGSSNKPTCMVKRWDFKLAGEDYPTLIVQYKVVRSDFKLYEYQQYSNK